MLHVDPADPLFNAVIETLAQSPGITVAELKKKLEQMKIRVTLQHIYRVVTKLVDAQVILKRKRTISLNLLWLSYIELFAQGAREKLQTSRDLPVIDGLKDGDRVALKAGTMHEVQTLWHHVLIHINEHLEGSEVHELHKYYSHAYWLVHPDANRDFYKRIAKFIHCYWLIGNESFLDCEAQRCYKDIFSIAVTDRPNFPAEGYLLNILGDYIIECILPPSVRDHLALLFRAVTSNKDWNPELLESLFHLQDSFTVNVSRNAKKSVELRGKIEHLIPRGLLGKARG